MTFESPIQYRWNCTGLFAIIENRDGLYDLDNVGYRMSNVSLYGLRGQTK